MASNLDIPQFGTGATPGLNAPRMQAIWTFLKSIALGGSGSVINSDKVAATTPSAVGLSMLSAADKAAQQALVEGAGFDADTVDGYHTGAVGVADSLVVRNASGQLQDMADYGIGTVCKSISNTDLNTVLDTGFYQGSNLGHAPTTALLIVESHKLSATNVFQRIRYVADLSYCKERMIYAGSPIVAIGTDANGWATVWNSVSDGNGGQPPAPKPNLISSAIGQVRNAVYPGVTTSTNTELPSGGTWLYFIVDFVGSSISGPNIASGGANITTGANVANTVFCWRIS